MTAAYCVVFAVVLVYVLIIALKLHRLEREVDELAGRTNTDFGRNIAGRAPAGPDEESRREPAAVG